MVVSHEQKEIIRSHFDLEKDNCRYYKKACKVCDPVALFLCRRSTFTHWALVLPAVSIMKLWQTGLLRMDMQWTSILVPWTKQG